MIMTTPEPKTIHAVEFADVEQGLGDAVALTTKKLNMALVGLDDKVGRLTREINTRQSIGFILKLIVVVSGVVIATGFLNKSGWIIQVIGGFISLITAVERIFANVEVLLSKVAARDAYRRIRREVERTHDSKIVGIVKNRVSKPDESAGALVQMQEELMAQIANVDNDIQTGLANKQYEVLGRLTLDDKK